MAWWTYVRTQYRLLSSVQIHSYTGLLSQRSGADFTCGPLFRIDLLCRGPNMPFPYSPYLRWSILVYGSVRTYRYIQYVLADWVPRWARIDMQGLHRVSKLRVLVFFLVLFLVTSLPSVAYPHYCILCKWLAALTACRLCPVPCPCMCLYSTVPT